MVCYYPRSKQSNHTTKARKLQISYRIQVRLRQSNQSAWNFGEIICIIGNLLYFMKVHNGRILTRYIDSLRTTCVPSQRYSLNYSNGLQFLRRPRRKLQHYRFHWNHYRLHYEWHRDKNNGPRAKQSHSSRLLSLIQIDLHCYRDCLLKKTQHFTGCSKYLINGKLR